MVTFLNPFKRKTINSKESENIPYEKQSTTEYTRSAVLTPRPSKFCSIALVCMMMTVNIPTFAAGQLKAFACAQGFGAVATGGRGGDIYHVTKLSDDGSVGTLRYGIEKANGPRTIVFDVGGIIHLNKIMYVRSDNLTIAGQSAPGGGITIAGYKTDIRGSNVIIRYMRFRLGDYNAADRPADPSRNVSFKKGNGNADLSGTAADALQVYRADRIMLDHISVSWGMDETISFSQAKDITLQHSIVTEGLKDSFHPKGIHSMGFMMYGGATNNELANGKGGITVYQNLIGHNYMRNPVIGGGDQFQGMDFTNNVIYNWGTYAGHSNKTKIKMNYINNYLIAGPSTRSQNLNAAMVEHNNHEGEFYIYQTGNYMDTDKDKTHDGKSVGREAFLQFEANEYLSKAFSWPAIDHVFSVEGAYQNILANVGASLVRDNVDTRIIKEVRTRTGKIIDSQNDVGGLSPIARGTALIDIDRDGMPDNWEKANGLDPKNANDRNRTNLSKVGYTNLEVYLDSIVASAGHCAAGGNDAEPSSNLVYNATDNSSETINDAPNLGSESFSIWDDSDAPVSASATDSGAVELGVKFMSDEDGVIEGIRFYKGQGNTGRHVGNLWTSTGQLLASATFTSETASGWQQVNFAEPVAINKDIVYVASYHAPDGHYASDKYVFANSGIDNGSLHLLQTGVSGGNGVYAYGSNSSFPKSSHLSRNYWVDVVFNNMEIKEEIIADEDFNSDFTTDASLGSTSLTIWDDVDAPASASAQDSSAVELGVKFMSDEDGVIEGIRFYKGKGNTGRHIGNLWTSTGQLLASATFTNETASGWQQVNFAEPVAITKDTVYVASYHAPNGHYASEQNVFAKSGIDNGSLHLLQSGVSGNNGVYAYGSSSSFPSSTWFHANYWVDVVFNNLEIKEEIIVAEDSTQDFTTNVSLGTSGFSIWDDFDVPVTASENDSGAVELGVKFMSDEDGVIEGIRFYKGQGNTGTHVGNLWTSTGQQLASATFTTETASGWQQVNFAEPVAITKDTVYVASYYAPNGHYASDKYVFANSGIDNGSLHLLQTGVSGKNGVYAYGSNSSFPSSTWFDTNYWVDVIFNNHLVASNDY